MGSRFQKIAGIGGIMLSSLSLTFVSIITQVAPSIAQTNSLQRAFDEAFYDNDKIYFSNRSIGRQIDFILGQGTLFRNSFTDNEINRDASNIHDLYVRALYQQVASDPVIRTPDLPNPFENSLLTIPLTPNLNYQVPGSGLIYNPIPLQ